MSMSTPKWSESNDDFGCIDEALINDMDYTSFCKEDRQIEVIDTKAVIKKDDTFLHDIEAYRSEYYEFLWRAGRSDWH